MIDQPTSPFTDKEKQVLACLIDGDSDKIIAKRTGISVHTIRTHLIKGIMRKLQVSNRTQAAVWAWQRQRNGKKL